MNSPIQIAAERFPEHVAFDDGKQQLTYSELVEHISKSSIASRNDLNEGDHIAWCPKNDLNAFITFWSIQARGLVACPISHRIPPSKRQEVLSRLEAHWIEPSPPELTSNADAVSPTFLRFAADRPATIVLTSGSTGMPKAVVHSMRAHTASAIGAESVIPLHPGDRWLWSLPLYHVSGLSILVRCAVAGATVVGTSTGFELNHELLHALRVTHLSVVNTQLRRLMSDHRFPTVHLKSVLLGGSAVDAKLVEQARSRGVNLHTTYGLTEMASQVTTSTPIADPSCSGTVLPSRKLRLNQDNEILVGGDPLCMGYYQSGTIHPVTDDHGWFHTRDLGRWTDNDQLTVVGRIDNQFISGGENIHPENIESTMLQMFGLEQVIVAPKPCESYGERPVAFVRGALPDDWQIQLRQRLSGFEIPTEILPWPKDTESDIKPNRKKLKETLRRSGS
ncbi:MAG: AMP-binding protein [Planctomycetota bacterium]